MRMACSKDDDKPKCMSQVIDALRGDVALVAIDIGIQVLLKPDGFAKLSEAMKDHVFSQARAEAKDFY